MPTSPYPFNRTGTSGGGTFSTAGGSGSAAGGLPPTGYDPRTGGIPQLPSPIKGGLSDLANVYKLAGGVNAFNTQGQLNDLNAKIPNYQQLVNQNSGNIMSGLKGQLPQDVIIQMIQNMAQRGIGRGMAPGSPNNNAAYVRALGTNSLALQGTAFNQLQQTIAGVPKIQEFDIQRMLDEEQKAKAMQSIYNSSPNPFASSEYLRNQVGAGVGSANRGGYAPPPAVPGGQLGGNRNYSSLGGGYGQDQWVYGGNPFEDANAAALKYAGVPRGNTYGGTPTFGPMLPSYGAPSQTYGPQYPQGPFAPDWNPSYGNNYQNPSYGDSGFGFDLPDTNTGYGPSYFTDDASTGYGTTPPSWVPGGNLPGSQFGLYSGLDFLNP